MKEKTLKKLYEMLFPYGNYDGNLTKSCILVEKELKNLCRDETRHVLLLLARYLHISFSRDTPTNVICGKIQKNIQNLCLNLGSDQTKASYIIGRVSGVPPIENTEILSYKSRKYCEYLRNHEDYSFLNNHPIYKSYNWKTGYLKQLLTLSGEYANIDITKTYTLQDATTIWDQPETKNFVYIPSLRIVDNPDKIIDYFVTKNGLPRNIIEHHIAYGFSSDNYDNDKFKDDFKDRLLADNNATGIKLYSKESIRKNIWYNRLYTSENFILDDNADSFDDEIATAIINGRLSPTATYQDIC